MKSCRGVTTTSLIIYVIAMLIVIGIIANINSFFYKNVLNLQDTGAQAELTKFNMYFLEEVKSKGNKVLEANNNYITFKDGNKFTFQDNCIYLNSIRICENVKNAQFTTEQQNNKTIVKVLFTIGDGVEYTKTNSYVMAD